MYEDLGTDVKKKLFAARLLQIDIANPQDIFKVAMEFAPPGDYGAALLIQREWTNDPIVIEERIRLVNEGLTVDENDIIKKKLVDRLMKIIDDPKAWAEDVIKAAKEIASISGITDENKTIINNNNTAFVTNKVMVVKDHGNDDEWEAKLLAQQEALTAHATPRVVN